MTLTRAKGINARLMKRIEFIFILNEKCQLMLIPEIFYMLAIFHNIA